MQDPVGNTSDANISVFAALGIALTFTTIAVNNTTTFTAAGGTPPYTYSLLSGTGSVKVSTGVYTAGVSSGSDTVRVTDGAGATAAGFVTINAALTHSITSQTTYVNLLISFPAEARCNWIHSCNSKPISFL